MTDHDPLDDLASAHLDGATTPVEAARVANDPDLLARVEAMRAVRAAVARPPSVDPAHRERAIDAALAAYDAQAEPAGDPPSLAPVRPTSSAAGRRRPGPSWRAAGVAGAVAALVALVPVIAALSSNSDDRTSDVAISPSAGDQEERTATADATAPAAVADSGAEITSNAGEAAPQALGTFEDDTALVAAARSATATMTDRPESAPPDPTSCIDELVAGLPSGTMVSLSATATLDGSPVAVVVTPDDVRIAGGDCTDVIVRPR